MTTRSKLWCFTLNNYTDDDLQRLSNPIDGVVYMVFGKEIASTGTPHLQGTICFAERKRLLGVKEVVGNAHCTVTRFLTQSIEYCKKDGNVTEWGIPPEDKEKKRSDLEEFKASVREGVRSEKELRELHSSVCAQYPRFVKDYLDDNKEKIEVPAHPLRDWQASLNHKLLLPPDPRKIIFIVDRLGDSGKSWFARYYCGLHENAQLLSPGKKADMTFVLNDSCRVFFLDCPRSKQGDFIQYDFLEELKNGYVFSPKYESRVKCLKTPHIVVMMNERPDGSKLSRDRYDITILS